MIRNANSRPKVFDHPQFHQTLPRGLIQCLARQRLEPGGLDPVVQGSLDEFLKATGRIEEIRGRVDGVAIPLPDAIGYYSGSIRHGLNLVAQSGAASSDSEITTALTAHSSLLEMKERSLQ